MIQLGNDWQPLLAEEFQKEYYLKLRDFLKKEYSRETVYPGMLDIFNALRYTPYSQTKVVILGQDPYHGPGQAHGLSFSVQPGVAPPPSLRNIFQELNHDLGLPIPTHGHLKPWADQGVLLLNTVLTVRAGQAHSHQGHGWEIFTDRMITLLGERTLPLVFILWGRPAQSKQALLRHRNHHCILTAPHPSPLSAHRGFFGSRPFSQANAFLVSTGQSPVHWSLVNQSTWEE